MKKLIISVLTALTAATGVIGVNGCGKPVKSTAVKPQTASISDNSHQDLTIQDVRNLQDFLLAKPTQEDLNGKPYDLDGDGKWDVFDLCLMKREVAKNMSISEKETETKMNIEVNGHLLTATLADNSSAKALAELIKSEPLTIEMNDYGDFEKVGRLPQSLPKSDEYISTEVGDIMLYQGNQMTIFYDTNSWSYTKLGKIDNVTQAELKEILGTGSVSVTFSLERKTGVFDMENKTVMLNSGYEMPVLGLGTYSLLDDTCVDSVVAELQSGGRLIDTAYMYHNEESVGEGIRQLMSLS